MIEKTNYCYKVKSFGLKNVGATYQRMMNKVFEKHIGRNLEVYVDDLIIKRNNMCPCQKKPLLNYESITCA